VPLHRAALVIVPLSIGLMALVPTLRDEPGPANDMAFRTETVDRGPILFSLVATGVFREGDGGRLHLVVNVPDTQIWRVRSGQPVTITASTMPSRKLSGYVQEVRMVAPGADAVTATIAESEATLAAIPAGTAAEVRIACERRDNVLRVPNAALHWQPPGTAPEPAPVQPSAGQARGTADLVQRLRRELRLDEAQAAAAEGAIEQARTAAFVGQEGDTNPAQRRDRFKAMRREIRERLTALLPPDQKTRLHEVIAAWSDAMRRDEPAAGQFYVVGDGDRPAPVAVRLGLSDGTMTEVIGAPVEPGTPVIVAATPRPRRLFRGWF
jgi:HlyD family secretion protein